MRALRHWRLSFGFCQGALNYANIRQRLLKYPYSKIDSQLLEKQLVPDFQDFLHRSIDRDSIAFACLKQHKQDRLEKYHQFLMGSKPEGRELSGRDLYSQYYMLNVEEIKQAVNSSTNVEEVTFNLKKLAYLVGLGLHKVNLAEFNLKQVEAKGTLAQKAYLLMIYNQEARYLNYLEQFIQQYQKSNKQQQFQAAFVVLIGLSLENQKSSLPQKLVTLCLRSISAHLEQIQDFQLFKIIENIFPTQYRETKQFTNLVLKQILNKLDEENVHPKMPLLLKTIKLRSKLRLDNSSMRQYVRTYPMRFKKIFLRKNIDKDPLLEAICNSQRVIQELEIRQYFTKYILDFYSQIARDAGCESSELVQNTKLALKYFKNFSQNQVSQISKIISTQLLEVLGHEPQVSMWLLFLLVRIDKLMIKNPKVRAVAESVISYCRDNYNNSKVGFDKQIALENIIQTSYHILRAHQTLRNPQILLEFDWRYVKTFQSLTYACYVISKAGLLASQNFRLLDRMSTNLEQRLSQGFFSSEKPLFNVLGAIEKSKCEQMQEKQSIGYLFTKIEDAFVSIWARKSVCPSRSDLLYIKRVFTQNRSNLNQQKQHKFIHNFEFITLLNESLDHPEQFELNLIGYRNKTKNKHKSPPRSARK